MLLTLKPPPLQNGYSKPHAYSPPQSLSSINNFSSSGGSGGPGGGGGTGSLPPLSESHTPRMSTPHRGLPPPLAMTLPNPERSAPSIGQTMQLPPPPPNPWQGADEPMRNWLHAKAEDDRRRQEEERTRQEGLKLEQRKIEQTMLRESLQGGVPPHMVPMVFAGMAGGNLANASLEWAQHYMAQISLQQHQIQQQQQQQQVQTLPPPQQSSPDLRRDSRLITGPQPNPYATQQPPALVQPPSGPPSQQSQSQTGSNSAFASPYQGIVHDRSRTQQPPLQAAPPTSVPRLPPAQSTLSRLNTGEMQIQPPPQSGLQLPGQHPLHQAQSTQQDQQATSPSIYFHHWVPPNSHKDPQTPSGKSQHESPYSQNATSHLRAEYTNSPKKRKTNAVHHAAAGVSSRTPDTSPSFNQLTQSGRRRAHSGQRSDGSSRGAHDALGPPSSRPPSRPRQQSISEGEGGSQRQSSSQPETMPSHHPAGPGHRRATSGTPKQEPEAPS